MNRSGICRYCLQYNEDCECCSECKGVDVHEFGCTMADTKPHRVMDWTPLWFRPRVLEDDTDKIPRHSIRFGDDLSGFESTETARST